MDGKVILVLGIIAGVAAASAFAFYFYSGPQTHDRDTLLKELELGIKQEIKEGNYRCCIEPACDMCYLGHWKWDDGSCRCDDLIAEGNFDDVCPQCKKGIEEGYCKSTIGTSCPIEP